MKTENKFDRKPIAQFLMTLSPWKRSFLLRILTPLETHNDPDGLFFAAFKRDQAIIRSLLLADDRKGLDRWLRKHSMRVVK